MKTVTAFLGFALVLTASAQDLKKHHQIVYPAVRVMTDRGGGSGTIIYSEDRPNKGEFETFILTNHHVIESAVSLVNEWSSLLGREVKIEKRATVKVEVFRYENLSVVAGRESFDADIKAYSATQDLAVLQLRTKNKFDSVATLRPKDKSKQIFLFDKVIVVGCSLLHDPLITEGCITSLNDEIENRSFWMSNAQIIFGSSGGAAYGQDGDNWSFIGIPSRVSIASWGNTPVTHMGYIIPITRIYEWLSDEKLDFIYDKTVTPKECFKKRSEMSKKFISEEAEKKEATSKPVFLPPPPKE